MKILLVLFIFAAVASAASIQIVIRDDAGRIQEDVTITLDPADGTGDDMLKSINDWRAAQTIGDNTGVSRFPFTTTGNRLFWGTVIEPPLAIKIDEFPYLGLAARKTTSDLAEDNTRKELRSGFK